jgi:hypothetical protein
VARRIPIGRLARALCLLAVLAPGPAAAQDLESAQTFVSGKDLVLYPPERGESKFRFLPSVDWIPYDRSLELSASQGEARVYLLQVDSGEGEDSPVMAYVVDKRRPSPPRAEPGSGVYRAQVDPALSAEEGADVFWSLIGPGSAPTGFTQYGETSKPSMKPPASGTATYSLLAYAADQYGNRSEPKRFVYRLAEPSLSAEAPTPDTATPALTAKPGLSAPSVDTRPGRTDLVFYLPEGADLLVDIDPQEPPNSYEDFYKVEASGGVARLRLSCPYGWSSEMPVYFGTLKSGAALYNPDPVSVKLSYPPEERPLPAAPSAPELAADSEGRGAFCVFPSYDGDIYVSLDKGESVAYSGPIPIAQGKDKAFVSWYGVDRNAQRSETRSATLSLPTRVQEVALVGVEDGAVIGRDAALKPSAPATIRYEMRIDGTMPPEPKATSPLVGDALAVTCPPGEERFVVIRYRPFSGDAAGEGKILRFTIDRKPPEPPKPAEIQPTYTERSRSVSIEPGSGSSSVYASVAADGKSAGFAPIAGPIELSGAESGPVSYMIRAYGVDAAGNKSAEMKAISLVVDRSSVYAAEDGLERGDGTPDRPFRSLDDAIAAALASGKRSVNLRGSLELRSPFASSRPIDLVGGFGKLWARDPSARASILVSAAGAKSPISQAGASMLLKGIDLSAPRSGSAPLVSLTQGAALVLEDCSIKAGGDGDLVIVSAVKSKVSATKARITSSRAMSCTAFACEDSDLTVDDSILEAASGSRVFGAFDLSGGSLTIRGTLIESYADIGLNMLSLRNASLAVDRCLARADSGSGFLRIGSFSGVRGEIRNSKVIVSWKGSGTLFEISGGGPDFRFDTVVADAERGKLRFFDVKGKVPQLWNSIFQCSRGGGDLLSADSVPQTGVVSANCAWGFDRMLTGAIDLRGIADLNALNGDSALFASRPNVSEAPSVTFASPVKSLAPLNPASACVDAAIALDGPAYAVDFRGLPRPSPGTLPDIGADELPK